MSFTFSIEEMIKKKKKIVKYASKYGNYNVPVFVVSEECKKQPLVLIS